MNRIIFALIFLCAGLTGCQDKWEDYYKQKGEGSQTGSVSDLNLLDYLKGQSQYSEFVKLLEETGVAEELTREQVLTVWVPTNETMPKAEIAAMSAEDKITLCKNHINYIALYNTKLQDDKIVKSLAGKNLTVKEPVTDQFSIDGVEVVAAEQACSNGVIHEVKGWILPRLNLYEYLMRAGDDYSVFRDSVLSYSDTVFKPSQSFILGTDSLGNTIYDSVFVIENTIFNRGDIRDEDKQFTLFLPSNDVLHTMFQDMENYFAGTGGTFTLNDSLKFMHWVLLAVVHEGKMDNYTGTSKSTFGYEWRTEFQAVSGVPFQCSNGLVYKVERLHVPKFLYLKTITAYPHYIFDLPEEEWDNYARVENGIYNSWDTDNRIVCYANGGATTADMPGILFEYMTLIKDNNGNVIPAKVEPGIYNIKVSYRRWASGTVKLWIDDKVVDTYFAGQTKFDYSTTPCLVKENFVIEGTEAHPLWIKQEDAVGEVHVSTGNKKNARAGRLTMYLIQFEPTDDNY